MVTKAYLANGKDGYDVLAKCNQVCELYVNTRCGVFKRGIKNLGTSKNDSRLFGSFLTTPLPQKIGHHLCMFTTYFEVNKVDSHPRVGTEQYL